MKGIAILKRGVFMDEDMNENIVACMSTDEDMNAIHRIQTEHRLKRVQTWDIKDN